MAAWLPIPSGFTGFAHRFVDPALGFALGRIFLTSMYNLTNDYLGWNYWFKYIITTPNNLIASVLVIQYWFKKNDYDGPGAQPALYVALFLAAIIAINYFGVGVFGEFEFWYAFPYALSFMPLTNNRLSSVKVLIIFGLIIFTLVMATGGGPNHDATGFRYWHDPGAFNAYKLG